MAFSAHKDPEQVIELDDSPELFLEKANRVVELIKNSKHCIIFTGAGISTAAGIPDFRGPNGVWTLKAQGKTPQSKQQSIKAVPTKTHMAIVELMKLNYVKFLVSQNTDGLHRKSGVPLEKFVELHGNQTLEKCHTPGCMKEYIRDYRTRTSTETHAHITGRKCSSCGGDLYDSIINFNENLPEKDLNMGFTQSKEADLCIVLGSSLTVTPAADIPKNVAKRGYPLIICNKQRTPLDDKSQIKIYASTDILMSFIMENLSIPIPKWLLRRFIVVKCQLEGDNRILSIYSIDSDGLQATIINKCRILVPFNYGNDTPTIRDEPFHFDKIIKKFDPDQLNEKEVETWPVKKINGMLNQLNINHSNVLEKPELVQLFLKNTNHIPIEATIELTFMGHYSEPLYIFKINLEQNSHIIEVIDYDVTRREWTFVERKPFSVTNQVIDPPNID